MLNVINSFSYIYWADHIILSFGLLLQWIKLSSDATRTHLGHDNYPVLMTLGLGFTLDFCVCADGWGWGCNFPFSTSIVRIWEQKLGELREISQEVQWTSGALSWKSMCGIGTFCISAASWNLTGEPLSLEFSLWDCTNEWGFQVFYFFFLEFWLVIFF